MTGFQPTGKRILVERAKNDTERKGILLLESDKKKNEGFVKAIGKDVKEIAIGDYIIYNPYSCTEYEEDKLIMSEDDVFCIRVSK